MIFAVNAAHWWGPFGYFYRNLLTNALADPFGNFFTLTIGILIGRKIKVHTKVRSWMIAPVHEHMDRHMDRIHARLDEHAAKLDEIADQQ